MARLTRSQRVHARNAAAGAALLAWRHRGNVHYTQGSRRWSGITGTDNAALGQYPNWADCSAFATWCLWNGLYLPFHKRDVVNGLEWKYGFTGTQIKHGRRITGSQLRRGDLVFYATRGETPTHVAVCVGRKDGRPMVVSHGSEAGPLYLRWNYRRVIQCRRYVHDGV